MEVSALVVTRDPKKIREGVVEGIKNNGENIGEVIMVSKEECEKPNWVDEFVVEKGPLGQARNVAIDKSNFEYVVMVDDDLVLLTDYFDKINLGYAACGLKIENKTEDYWANTKAKELQALCIIHNKLPCMGTLYNKGVLNNVGGFDGGRGGGEDNELHGRLLEKGYKIKYINELGAKHYFTEGLLGNIENDFKSGMAKENLLRIGGVMLLSPIRGLRMYLQLKGDKSMSVPALQILKYISKFCGRLWGVLKK